jgi:hypothetical protein
MTEPQEIIINDFIKELKEQHNEQMNAVLLHPEVYKNMKYNRPMNVFEKLQAGWYWIRECFDEWCWTMTHDDGEFFNYLQSDYVKYEEDMYYVRKGDL